jgi:ribosome biogenesis GTPase
LEGKVYKSTGSWYLVKSEDNNFYECKIKGKFRLNAASSTNPVVVGDIVNFNLHKQEKREIGIIEKIKDRKNYILRKSVNLSKQTHILASNIDLLLLVITLKDPITTTSFIDRFLVSAQAYSIKTILIFNKFDTYKKNEIKNLNETINIYKKIGYQCLTLSTKDLFNIKALKQLIEGKTIMLGGHSGVGKTSIVNMLKPSLNLKVSGISQHSQGKHTTTYAELFELDSETELIDTPGIKGFGLINYDNYELGDYFPEFLSNKDGCKFSNCMHLNEPNCKIKYLVENGDISQSRYKSYLQMLDSNDLKHR